MSRFSVMDLGRWTVDVEQEWIDVTSSFDQIDPEWRGVDAWGHPHSYRDREVTLTEVVDESYMCTSWEEHDEWWETDEPHAEEHEPHQVVLASHQECRLCGDTVKFGIIPAFTPRQIRGRMSMRLTVSERDRRALVPVVSGEQASGVLAAMQTGDSDTVVRLLDEMLTEAEAAGHVSWQHTPHSPNE